MKYLMKFRLNIRLPASLGYDYNNRSILDTQSKDLKRKCQIDR